jgi:hypothetical protein
MVVDLSRGLPHAALARITQSLASDLRAQVLCFDLKGFQIVLLLRSRALRNPLRVRDKRGVQCSFCFFFRKK